MWRGHCAIIGSWHELEPLLELVVHPSWFDNLMSHKGHCLNNPAKLGYERPLYRSPSDCYSAYKSSLDSLRSINTSGFERGGGKWCKLNYISNKLILYQITDRFVQKIAVFIQSKSTAIDEIPQDKILSHLNVPKPFNLNHIKQSIMKNKKLTKFSEA